MSKVDNRRTDQRRLEIARQVLSREAEGILAVRESLDQAFCRVVGLILDCKGAVAVCGVGKAGLVGRKIAATLASTGTRSMWLDPVDAMHGDLGMLSREDVGLLISNSGQTGELLLVAQALRDLQIRTIAMTCDHQTPLAQACDLVLPLGRHLEADPLNLAPTTSTTVMLALGDALAIALATERGFTREDYAQLHPAGALGLRLRKVKECMRSGSRVVLVGPQTTIIDALHRVTQARCGICLVVDGQRRLLGVFTDGDLRRCLDAGIDVLRTPIGDCMTSPCKSVDEEALVEDAVKIMRASKINALAVVNSRMQAVGILDIQDVA
ncbi:MAG: KpsF/GutQ family sugar-phosphate isomerase [Sedimentisphaerales bacterium]|jgi:arabinose-5-phosphate isomerase|nr:KpsF/GutQ family sugar-phosphate isomerase [Sedimentisphaerales bacterium]